MCDENGPLERWPVSLESRRAMKMGRWKGGLCRCKADLRQKWVAGKVSCLAGKPIFDNNGTLERHRVSLESRSSTKMGRWKVTPFGALKI